MNRRLSYIATTGILALGLAITPAAFAATPLNAIVSLDNMDGANTGDARVRVLHASPDAPAVDVWVNGAIAFADIAFEEITDYASLPPGTYNVKVEPAGAGGAGPFVIDADLDLGSMDYTVIATDKLANLTPIILVDTNADPATDSAKVRFFHGSADAPAVDLTLPDGTPLFSNIAFQEDGGYIEVPAGTYSLQARAAGTDVVALNVWNLELQAGDVYTAYATGLLAYGSADRTAYVNDDRFRIDVSWTDFEGNSGVGFQSGLTDDTAYFWFFDPNNVEQVVKVLDGTAINSNYWVYYGSLSNVEFEISITDMDTEMTKSYQNQSGTFASAGDVDAFPAQ